MTSSELFIAHAVKVLALAVLVGVFKNRLHRYGWSIVAYLLLVITCNSLVSFWPDRFFKQWFWILWQAAADIGKLMIASELAYRAFAAFPGALRRARATFAITLLLTTLSVTSIPLDVNFRTALEEWHPRVLSGSIWLLTGTACLVIWYRLPLARFPRVLLMGLAGYLLVFVTLLNLLRLRGPGLRDYVNALDGWAYLGLMGWWAYEAWRPPTSGERAIENVLKRHAA